MSQTIDPRSQTNLDTLRTKAKPWFSAFLLQAKAKAAAQGLDVRLISGNRTWPEQDALYAQGRTKPGDIVTDARGGQSNHNYGIAVDIGIFTPPSTYHGEHPLYDQLGPLGESMGLEWGGHWQGRGDKPHYQIPVGRTVGQLQALVKDKNWSAVDALIPTFGTPPAKPEQDAPTADPVAVFFDAGAGTTKALSLDAWYVSGRVWVALADWCDYFGGSVAARTPTTAILRLNNVSLHVTLQTVAGKVAAPFGEVNGLQSLDYSFDGQSRPRKLTIHKSL